MVDHLKVTKFLRHVSVQECTFTLRYDSHKILKKKKNNQRNFKMCGKICENRSDLFY